MTAAYGRKWRRTKKTLDESERGEWKSWLKVNIQKTKIMTTSLIISRQIDREIMETVRDFIFLSYKITANCDWSHEIKRPLLFGIKIMTNLDRILKSRDIILQTNVHLVRAMVFPVVMYGCESWTIKKAESWRSDAFELWHWRRLLRVPWTARRSNQSILKEINPEYHWKDWCWSWNSHTLATWCEEVTHWKRPQCWEILKAVGERDDRGWDGWMASPTDGHEFEQVLQVGDRQGSLACCSPRGHKESDMTERLNWTDHKVKIRLGRKA